MPSTSDIAYFRRRVAEEKRRALSACEGAIRRLHLDFADQYAARADDIEREISVYARRELGR